MSAQSDQPDLNTLLQAVEALGNYKFKDPGEQHRAMRATRDVSDKLQGTYDKILEMWGAPSKDAAVKIGIDVNLWTKWDECGDGEKAVKTSEQLAVMTGVQPVLMSSLLRHLAAWNLIEEEGPETYSPTEFSRLLATPRVVGTIGVLFDALVPTFPRLPIYLYSNSYHRPTNHKWTPLSYAKDFPGGYFEWMSQNTAAGAAFDHAMQGLTAGRPSWLVPYPVKERLLDGHENRTGDKIVVDVGGGLGHDLVKLFEQHPTETSGRLVLQEQPHVVESAKGAGIDPGIELMAHDFFTEQPIKGARAYFMHSILHDWADDKCQVILNHLKSAMTPGGPSRILINEIVMPSTKADPNFTCLDMIMMGMSAGRERTEAQWRELLDSCGLKIEKIWSSPAAVESVIEVVLPA